MPPIMLTATMEQIYLRTVIYSWVYSLCDTVFSNRRQISRLQLHFSRHNISLVLLNTPLHASARPQRETWSAHHGNTPSNVDVFARVNKSPHKHVFCSARFCRQLSRCGHCTRSQRNCLNEYNLSFRELPVAKMIEVVIESALFAHYGTELLCVGLGQLCVHDGTDAAQANDISIFIKT